MAETLAQLIDRVRRGEPSAVADLVARFGESARRLAEALVGDVHEAEDVVQEAFIAALDRIEDLRTPAAFPGWFRQIVRTHANRAVRRRRERVSATAGEPAADVQPPSRHLEQQERRARLRAALAELPPAGRETVELFYFDERTIAEVAEALELPTGTVKRRLYDARTRLRDLLIGAEGSMDARGPNRTSDPGHGAL